MKQAQYRFGVPKLGVAVFGTLFAISCGPAIHAIAQEAELASEVVERGAHHKVVRNISRSQLEDGSWLSETNSYVELASGMHRLDSTGAWVEASAELVFLNNRWKTTNSVHQVSIASNCNSEGAISLVMPDGKTLNSHVLGISYYDAASGDSVMLAQITNAIATYHPDSGQIIFSNALDTIRADIRYQISRKGLEQDVIIREQLPSPSDYGLDPASTRLEVITEFITPPEPQIHARGMKTNSPAAGKVWQEPVLTDDGLDFESMRIGPGQAFLTGKASGGGSMTSDEHSRLEVAKRWMNMSGRKVLVEAVEYLTVTNILKELPQAPTGGAGIDARRKSRRIVAQSKMRNLPVAPAKVRSAEQAEATGPNRREIAATHSAQHDLGLVIDYDLTLSSYSGYTFYADTNYRVTGPVAFSGTTTFQGGTVIKLADNPVAASAGKLTLQGPVVCDTGPYRPVIITAETDHSVGQKIGTAAHIGAGRNLNGCGIEWSPGNNTPLVLSHFRFAHLAEAIRFVGGSDYTEHRLKHIQLVRCGKGLSGSSGVKNIRCLNILASNVATLLDFPSVNAQVRFEHLSARNVTAFSSVLTGQYKPELSFFNSVIDTTTCGALPLGAREESVTKGAVFFATNYVAGAFYLPASSVDNGQVNFDGLSATTLDPELVTELQTMTVNPPTVLSAPNCAAIQNLSRTVARDGNLGASGTWLPDRGYHYPALDYVIKEGNASGCAITIGNGVAVAFAGTKGISLSGATTITVNAHPLLRNQLTRYQSVQEQSDDLFDSATATPTTVTTSFKMFPFTTAGGSLSIKFTDINLPADSSSKRAIGDLDAVSFNAFSIRDCSIRGASLNYFGMNSVSQTASVINSILEGCSVSFTREGTTYNSPLGFVFVNNLVRYGAIAINYANSTGAPAWDVSDNLFVGVTPTGTASGSSFVASYNAFSGASAPVWSSNNRTVPTLDFVAGQLGDFYYPETGSGLAQLRDADVSRSAADRLLGGHTTSAFQTREEGSFLDIGFHYVATKDGVPTNSDGDPLADYLDADSWFPGMYVGPNLSYADNAAATKVSTTGWVAHPGVANLDKATLKVFITNRRSTEILDLPTTGTTKMTGASVYVGANVIGTCATGTQGEFTVTFNTLAQPSHATLVLRAIQYRGSQLCPPRKLNFTYTTGSGQVVSGSKDINVTGLGTSVPPVLTFKNTSDQADVWKQLPRLGPPLQVELQLSDSDSLVEDISLVATVQNINGTPANPLLIPLENVTFEGTGWTRKLSIKPEGLPQGFAQISVTASDCRGQSSPLVVKVYRGSPLVVGTLPTIIPAPTGAGSPVKPFADGVVLPWDNGIIHPVPEPNLPKLIFDADASFSFSLAAGMTGVSTLDFTPSEGRSRCAVTFTSAATVNNIQTVLRAVGMSCQESVSVPLSKAVRIVFKFDDGKGMVEGIKEVVVVPGNRPPKLTLSGTAGQRILSFPATSTASIGLMATISGDSGLGAPAKAVRFEVFTDTLGDGNRSAFAVIPISSGSASKTFTQAQFRGTYAVTTEPRIFRVRATTTDGSAEASDEMDVIIYPAADYPARLLIQPFQAVAPNSAVNLKADLVGTTTTPAISWSVIKPDGSTQSLASATYTPTLLGRHRIVASCSVNSVTVSDEALLNVCSIPSTPADVVFVVDFSGSMVNAVQPGFPRVDEARSVVSKMMNWLDPDLHRVGLVTFNDGAEVAAQLGTPYSVARLAMQQSSPVGYTQLGAGLSAALDLLEDRVGHRQVPKAIFVITDGTPTDPITAEAQAALARARGVRIFALVMPGGEPSSLIKIAGRPSDAVLTDFQKAPEIGVRFLTGLCDDSNTAPAALIHPPRAIIEDFAVDFRGIAADDKLPLNSEGKHVGLKYDWQVRTPQGGAVTDAFLSDPTSANTSIVFHSPGDYLVELTVSENVASGALSSKVTAPVNVQARASGTQCIYEETYTIYSYKIPGLPSCRTRQELQYLDYGSSVSMWSEPASGSTGILAPPAGVPRFIERPPDSPASLPSQSGPASLFSNWRTTSLGTRPCYPRIPEKCIQLPPIYHLPNPRVQIPIHGVGSLAKNLPDSLRARFPTPSPTVCSSPPNCMNWPAVPDICPDGNNDVDRCSTYGAGVWPGPDMVIGQPATPGVTHSSLNEWIEYSYTPVVDCSATWISIVVRETNCIPAPPWIVSAGPDRFVSSINQNLQLEADIQDLRSPAPPAPDTVLWSVVEWPGTQQPNGNSQGVNTFVTFVSGQNTQNPVVSFSQIGRYRLRFTASSVDPAEMEYDDVEILVGLGDLSIVSDTDVVPFFDHGQTLGSFGQATFAVHAANAADVVNPQSVEWRFLSKPAGAADLPANTTGTSITHQFTAAGVYDLVAISDKGLARRQVIVHTAPVVSLEGHPLIQRSGGYVFVKVVDDGYPNCSGDSTDPDVTGRCLQYSWKSASPRIVFNDPHAATPRVTITGNGDLPNVANLISVTVSDGQLSNSLDIPTSEFQIDLSSAPLPVEYAMPIGQDTYKVSTDWFIPGSIAGRVNDSELQGTAWITTSGREVVYQKPSGNPCAPFDQLKIDVQTQSGEVQQLWVKIHLPQFSSSSDLEVSDSLGESSTYLTIGTSQSSGPLDFSSISIRRRGCPYQPGSIPFTVVALDEVAVSPPTPTSKLSIQANASATGPTTYTLTAGASTGASRLRASLRVESGQILYWPITVLIPHATASINAAYLAGLSVDREVRVGDWLTVMPDYPLGVNDTVSWSLPPGVGATVDIPNSKAKNLIFFKTGSHSVTCTITLRNGATILQTLSQTYTFLANETAVSPLAVGGTYELNLDTTSATGVTTPRPDGIYTLQVLTTTPSALPLKTVPALNSDQFTLAPGQQLMVYCTLPGTCVVKVTYPDDSERVFTLNFDPNINPDAGGGSELFTLDSIQKTSDQGRIVLSDNPSSPTAINSSETVRILGLATPNSASKAYEIRLESMTDSREYSLTPGSPAPRDQVRRVLLPQTVQAATGLAEFGPFDFNDIPDGDYRLSVYVFANANVSQTTFLSEAHRYLRLQVPRFSGVLQFSRVDFTLGAGDGALKIERTYSSEEGEAMGAASTQKGRLSPGWRLSTPGGSIKLLERRKVDTLTGLSIRNPNSSRDLLFTPEGSPDAIRYTWNGYSEEPVWLGSEGLGIIRPLEGEVGGTVTQGDDFWASFYDQDSSDEWVGRYTFVWAKGDSQSLGEFDFAGFRWMAPGGVTYVFGRGDPIARPFVENSGGRVYDSSIYTQAPTLRYIQLGDGSRIETETLFDASNEYLRLKHFPDLSATVPTRVIKLVFNLPNAASNPSRLTSIQEEGALVPTLVQYFYGSDGNLSNVTRFGTQIEGYAYSAANKRLLTSIRNEANQLVLEAQYDASGNLMLSTDETQVARQYRVPSTGSTPETIYTPMGNRTIAQYTAQRNGAAFTSWIPTTTTSYYVQTLLKLPNIAGLPTRIETIAPAMTVSWDNFEPVSIPAQTKIVTRVYDDPTASPSQLGRTTGVNDGRRVIEEKVSYSSGGVSVDPGKSTLYSYGTGVSPVLTIRHDGVAEHVVLDEQGRPERQGPGDLDQFPTLESQTFYDRDTGQVTASIDARGLRTDYEYVEGRLVATQNSMGLRTVNVHAETTDPQGRWRAGDLISTVVKDLGLLGSPPRLLSRTDYEYDSQGRQTVSRSYRTMYADTDFAADGTQAPSAIPETGPVTVITGGKIQVSVHRSHFDPSGRVFKTEEYQEGSTTGPQSSNPYFTFNDYDGLGRLAATTDRYGRKTKYFYDISGNLVQTVHPDGSLTRTVYDINNRPIVSQSEYMPVVQNGAGELETSDSGGTRTVYDGFGRVHFTETLLKVLIAIQLTSSTSQGSFYQTSVQSHADNQLSANRIHRVERFYDALDQVTETLEYVDGTGTSKRYVKTQHKGFFEGGNWTRETWVGFVTELVRGTDLAAYAGAERTSREQIDSTGRRVSSSIKFRDSGSSGTLKESVTEYFYEKDNEASPDVHLTRSIVLNRVDAAGNNFAEQNVELRNHYDIAGNRVAALDAQGQGTYYGYNALGQLIEVQAPATTSYAATKYRYDESGNRVWMQDANGRVTMDSFDSFGRRIQRNAPDAGTNLGVEQWAYDIPPPAANITNWTQQLTYTDPDVKSLVQSFDTRGRLAREEPQMLSTLAPGDALRTQNPTYIYRYTRIASMPTWARASGEPLSSGVRREIEEQRNDSNLTNPGTPQLLRLTRYYQDGGGRLRAKATAEGLLVYGYSTNDARGRLAGVSAYNVRYPGTSIYASQNGTLADTTDLTLLGTANVTNAYQWDALGRLSKLTDASGGDAAADTVYAYENGRLLGMRYPNGLTTVYQTDSLGDVERIGFVYEASVSLFYANVVTDAYKANYSSTEGYFKYKRDLSGQRRLTQDSIPQSTTPITREFRHTYDPGHRLHREYAFTSFNSVAAAGASVEYSVDLLGNRSERKVDLGNSPDPGYATKVVTATGYIYDAQDKVSAYTTGSAVTLTYDTCGNVAVNGSGQTYTHDRRNRLIQSGSVTMSYDPEGLRVRKTSGTTTTLYLVDSMNPTGYAQVLCEYQYTGTAAPAVQRSYTYGLDLISHRHSSGADPKKYYSTDALGTTRFLTDTTGTTVLDLVASNYHYDAFGTLLGSSSTPDTAYLYTGEQWDADVGAYYLRARWYHPGLGRFLERDSYEGDGADPISRNRYLYTHTNPINGIDPSGHENLISVSGAMSLMMPMAMHELRGANAALRGARALFGASDGIDSLINGLQYAEIISDYVGFGIAAAGVSRALISLGPQLASTAKGSLSAMRGVAVEIERSMAKYPGYTGQYASRGLRKSFASAVAQLGYKVKRVTSGGSRFVASEGVVYLDTTSATPGTLVDEFSHAFGHAAGKGANLPTELQAVYQNLRATLKAVGGDTGKMALSDNTLYHQLELLNLMNGLKGRLPGFVRAIPESEINEFLSSLDDLL